MELPRRHAPLKQNIQLTIRPSLRLRQTEIRPHPTEEADPRPEKTSLSTPIPRSGVKHVWRDDTIDNTEDVVDVTGQHDGFGLQAGGGQFGNEGVADGAHSQIVDERVDEEKGANTPGGVLAFRYGSEADTKQQGGEDGKAPAIDSPTAGVAH